ncbi:SDR family NAD(P)-dependent oxidoreductase [Falsiroseomonas oryzae]|uniref:SDR family NAD(P)-dependent oxidoreductase n=1 Tax=Falsiroseomonas oryzae TaxID=2766473 RepID=UPI0022EB4A8E|nr:SDR family oxidoreductase [Roseomonas sp. MO-31]
MARADRFVGRVGLVTGAASGLGRDVALGLAQEGARLLLLDRDGAALAEVARQCPGAEARVADVSDAAAMQDAAARLDRIGPPTLLVTAAGILGPTVPLPEVAEADWDRLFAVNVKGTWLALKHVVPRMEAAGGGAVVTFASGAGLAGNAVFPAYSASKGAVVLMTRSLATGHAAKGIRANAVCPGPIDTPMLRDSFAQAGDGAAAREEYTRARNPMGRFGTPAEVAAAVLFLLSDEASYLNGVALPVDGGRLA